MNEFLHENIQISIWHDEMEMMVTKCCMMIMLIDYVVIDSWNSK